ncbi:MAG: tRNA epoxyqueuosine(34) reductase QueG [Bacteroidetes bacterium]|nr:tRNA epoxyqueuosine(34) reductase QueG [Bacteroidota bacterium]
MKLTNQHVIESARDLEFELIGFSKAETLEKESQRLEEWLKRNYQAGMTYMQRNLEKRKDVKNILPEAKSVISLGLNYYTNKKYENSKGTGKVSRYAWGKDYHLIIWEKLDKLVALLKNIDPNFEAKTYVDTGPVMDKAWAVKSGMGWMGKHTNVINKEHGSWFFIATVITNYEFEYNEPIADFCGTCTACIDACPTNAIVDEYVVDANRCISYLTIENKGEISKEFSGKFDNWIFGCDICQDVCPWNSKFSKQTNEKEFFSNGNKELRFDEIDKLTDQQFKQRFAESPILRTKLKGLKRNADFINFGK